MISTLETDRLHLRAFTLEDAPRMFDIYRSPDIFRHISLIPPKTITDVLNHLSELMDAYPVCGFRATFIKNSNQLIGRCGLVPHVIDGSLEYEIAYLVAPEFWNQGFATEAAQRTLEYDVPRLQLKRVIALIHANDPAAQSVARKIGLTEEKEVTMPDGAKRLLFASGFPRLSNF